jgi:uncharacterized Fe-S center protein
MLPSKVYFSDLRACTKENLFSKLLRLMDRVGLEEIAKPRSYVAIKLHFGEKGNTGFIRPIFVRRIVDRVKELGALPFLTDTNTLYTGLRSNSVAHIETATENGFAYCVVNAPIIIADGVRGTSYASVKISQEMIKTAYLGKEVVESDALISVAHFTGHELSGFAGAIKNLGMGCASRRGKLEQHSDLSPKVKKKKCVGCGECVPRCAQNAISLMEEKATIDPDKCIGCGECILICSEGAIKVRWSKDIAAFQKKMAEYAFAVMQSKRRKALFLNFLTNISPACDCHDYSDAPIVHDIGIVASSDPVAIDQASVDLVNQQASAEGSYLTSIREPSNDKFISMYPKIDWSIQLTHAEKIGLGRRDYELVGI